MTSDKSRLGIVQDGPVAFDGQHYWNHRPMGRYLKQLASQLGRIDIYASCITQENPAYEQWAGMKMDPSWASVHALPTKSRSVIEGMKQEMLLFPFYYDQLQRNDWILFFLPFNWAFPGIIARKLQRRPYALYLGNDWKEIAPYTRWKGTRAYWIYFKIGQLLYRSAIRGARFVLTAGEALRKKAASLGAPAYSTVPRMNLIQDDIFVRNDTCCGETITCLFVGSLIPRKGLTHLVEAFAVLRRKGWSVELLIIGDGELRSSLLEQIRELGVTDVVKMSGHVANGPALWDIYRKADIFVLPTKAEGFPRVLYEAMSQSLPIITTNVSGIPYLMNDKNNALLVPPGDTEALATAIEEIIRNPGLRQHLILEGLRTVRSVLEGDPGVQVLNLINIHS